MIAALKSNDKTLMSILSIIYGSNDLDLIGKFLHQKNKKEETILKIVIAHDSDLSIHCELLNKMEQDFHRECSIETLDQCLKNNIGPHRIAEMSIAKETDYKKSKNCWKKFLAVLVIMTDPMVKLAILKFDIGTDVWLTKEYSEQKDNHQFVDIECKKDALMEDLGECSTNPSYVNDLIEIPSKLSTEAAFNYSVAFLLLPIISYLMEWIYNKGPKYLEELKSMVNFQGNLINNFDD